MKKTKNSALLLIALLLLTACRKGRKLEHFTGTYQMYESHEMLNTTHETAYKGETCTVEIFGEEKEVSVSVDWDNPDLSDFTMNGEHAKETRYTIRLEPCTTCVVFTNSTVTGSVTIDRTKTRHVELIVKSRDTVFEVEPPETEARFPIILNELKK